MYSLFRNSPDSGLPKHALNGLLSPKEPNDALFFTKSTKLDQNRLKASTTTNTPNPSRTKTKKWRKKIFGVFINNHLLKHIDEWLIYCSKYYFSPWDNSQKYRGYDAIYSVSQLIHQTCRLIVTPNMYSKNSFLRTKALYRPTIDASN